MKVLKKPVVAILLCLAVILVSTCINTRVGLEKKYDRVCGDLTQSIISFAAMNDLEELELKARSAMLDGDYSALIDMYNRFVSAGYIGRSSADKAVDVYAAFFRMLQRFPTRQLAGLLGISF